MANRLELIVKQLSRGDPSTIAKSERWTNFAQLGSCLPQQHHYPTTTQEVADLVARLYVSKEPCRVAGNGKSPNACTFTTRHLIHTTSMSNIISVNINEATITCQGGAMLYDVFEALDSHNLMMRCVPSITDLTVAGALANGAHSSGINSPSLCGYVLEIVVVDGTGTVHTFNKDTPHELSMAACHLGALGVVVQVTLQAEAKVLWRVRHAPVSLKEIPRVLAQRVTLSEYYRLLWVPYTSMCYETSGGPVRPADEQADAQTVRSGGAVSAVSKNTDKPDASRKQPKSPKKKGTDALMMAVKSMDNSELNTTSYGEWSKKQHEIVYRLLHSVNGSKMKHEAIEAALAMTIRVPELQPIVNKAYQAVFLNTVEEVYGTATECLSMDCLFKQWACEWAVEADKALDVLAMVQRIIRDEKLCVHFPVEFRFSSEDDARMSPGYGRKTCWVGIVMYRPFMRDARDTVRAYKSFSREMTKMGGRPHWAKFFEWRHRDIAKAYGANWTEFLEFRRKMDPSNLFVNDWFRQLMTNA